MDWNCAQTEERLSDFLDRLMAPDESAAFSAHMAGCADCTRLAKQVGGLLNRMRALEPVEQPKQLVAKILNATLGSRPQTHGWKQWFDWTPAIFTPRFAMGAVTVAILMVVVFRTVGVTPGKIKRADLSPVSLARSANRQVHLAYARSAKFVNDLRVVYEIQSALQRTQDQAAPSVAPTAPPSERQAAPPSSDPQEKSQGEPHPRSQIQSGTMMAWIVPAGFPRSTR
jgi:anti-sigma factor RsiW